MALQPFTVTIQTKEDAPFNVLPDAPISIFNRTASGLNNGLASIFEDAAGLIPIAQTGATTNSLGQLTFYAESAGYNASFNNNGTPVIIAIDVGITQQALINDLSQNYEFATVALFKASLIEFPDGKTIHLNDRDADFAKITGTGTANTLNVIASTSLSQSIELISSNNSSVAWGIVANGITDPIPGIQLMANFGFSVIELADGDYSAGDFDTLTVPDTLREIRATVKALGLNQTKLNGRLKRIGVQSSGDLTGLISNLKQKSSEFVFIEESTAGRFFVHLPTGEDKKRTSLRYENTESMFDGPIFTARPFIQSQINHTEVEPAVSYPFLDGAIVGTWVVSTFYHQSSTTNDSVTTFVLGDKIELHYQKVSNAGIATILINGQPSTLAPTVDMYSAGTTAGITLIADDLPYGLHKVEVIVSGTKNPASSDFRVYLETLGYLRGFQGLPGSAFDGLKTDFALFNETIDSIYRSFLTATTYAIQFRAQGSSDTFPFIGSIHGFEELVSMKVFIDNVEQTDWLDGVGGFEKLRSGRVISIEQTLNMFHPDVAGVFATILLTETMTANGYSQGYKLIWVKDVEIINGYTQMWAADGGLDGGIPGDVNGWADRARFSTGSDYLSDKGDFSAVGRELCSQVLLYGSRFNNATFPLRNTDSGNKAMLVTMPSIELSMQNFTASFAADDAIWVEQRATIKKIYVQSLRGFGDAAIGESLQGMLRVDFIYAGGNAMAGVMGF